MNIDFMQDIIWLDFIGLFLFLAGFVIALGAVTVIELHGFLARKSPYWTEATTRTHKITKPLIWSGFFIALVGGMLFYRNEKLEGIVLLHTLLIPILIANGLFLTFRVSPYLLKKEKEGKAQELLPSSLQKQITISFCVSVIGGWGAFFLLVLYLASR